MTIDSPPPRADASDRGSVVAALAPGAELLGASPEEDGRYLARREDGRVVRMPEPLYRVASLLDGTRDLAAVAAEIGVLEDRACSVAEVRLVVERRLVPAGLVLPLPDSDARPDDPQRAEDVGSDDDRTREARGGRRGALTVLALLLSALVLVVATAAVTTLVVGGQRTPPSSAQSPPVVPAAGDAPAPVTAPGGITGPPTLLGRVVEIPDVRTVVVDVAGRRLVVDVAGLAPRGTPTCAADDARAFAERTLGDQEVTLVPDPTLPPGPPDRWQAYLVLESQLSYTDAALRAGWATAGEGRYRAGFVDGQAAAEQGELGQWGPPCRASG